ncbi:MAG: MBL fold metallo-hydrolase [Candidatus Paceibacterota bacterium]
MTKKLDVTFWGGVGTVTGANFLVESQKTKFLVDCGMLQGTVDSEEENKKLFPYDASKIDYLFVTHAHMDHIGRIPKLVKEGFSGTIYSTPETKEISSVMFQDALKIMTSEALDKDNLLYNSDHLNKALSLWKTIEYHKKTSINDDFFVYLKDAGHILGSSIMEFIFGKTKFVFTGDTGNSPTPLLKDTEKITDATYMVMDSVYGDRNHEPKDERDRKFKRIVEETISSGGALVIPAFSIERTQVILYLLNNLIEDKVIKSVPVFLDSPLAIKVTDIYKRLSKNFNQNVKEEISEGDDIFNFPKLHITQSSMDSKEIVRIPNPKIIIAGSGMSSGGRIIHHEINFLPDPKSTLLMMGYQAVGTLGRMIEERPSYVNIKGEKVKIRARIENISGYSSHKDSDHLVEFVSDTKDTLKKVFVVMGEPSSSTFLVQRLRDYLEVDAVYPERGKVYELEY